MEEAARLSLEKLLARRSRARRLNLSLLVRKIAKKTLDSILCDVGYVCSVFQVLLHRDWTCAVRGLRVPHWSAVRKRPLGRTVSCPSIKLIVDTRDT